MKNIINKIRIINAHNKIIVLILLGFLVTFTTSNYIESANSTKLLLNSKNFVVLFSIFSYFVSVFFRSIRVFYLSEEKNSSIKKLFFLQYICTALQLILPFRLGDIARVYLFRNYLNGFAESFYIFVGEKFFDTLVTFSLILFWVLPSKSFDINYFLSFNVVILLTILFCFLIIFPDLINKLYKYLLYNPNKNIKLSLIKNFYSILKAQKVIFGRLKGKFLIITLISYVIWIFDSLSFIFIIFSSKITLINSLLLGPLVAISSVLPSPPLGISGSVTIGLYWSGIITGFEELVDYSFTYSVIVYGGFISIVIFLAFLIKFIPQKIFFTANEK